MHPSPVTVSTAATHSLPAQTSSAILKGQSPAEAQHSYLTVVSLQEEASRNSEVTPHQHFTYKPLH